MICRRCGKETTISDIRNFRMCRTCYRQLQQQKDNPQ